MRISNNAAKVVCRSRAHGLCETVVSKGEGQLTQLYEGYPSRPSRISGFPVHYVKGYLYKKEGRTASAYYLWRAKRLHGRAAIDAYHAGRRAWKVLELREGEAP